jgi:galactokinase
VGSLEHEAVKGNFTDYKLLLCNTNTEHALVDTAYNNRRQECEEGVRIIGVGPQRDITLENVYRLLRDQSEVHYSEK